jgi:hypothetical protein
MMESGAPNVVTMPTDSPPRISATRTVPLPPNQPTRSGAPRSFGRDHLAAELNRPAELEDSLRSRAQDTCRSFPSHQLVRTLESMSSMVILTCRARWPT